MKKLLLLACLLGATTLYAKRWTADEVKAYTDFIGKLCEFSANAKRVSMKEKAVDNEKYAFRCFLLRLGFIGADFKTDRKILLRNLDGSSAFRDGGADDENAE